MMTSTLAKVTPMLSKATIWTWVQGHRIIAGIIAIAVLGGGYVAYGALFSKPTATSYIVTTVATSTVISTISGTGQVTASSEVDLVSKTSGALTSLNVSAGQSVHAGDRIASIDLGTSGFELQSARLSLEKAQTTNSSNQTDAQSSLTSAQNNFTSAKESGVSQLTNGYGSMEQIISSLTTLFGNSGYLPANGSDSTARLYRDQAYGALQDARIQLTTVEASGRAISRASSDADIQTALDAGYSVAKSVAEAAAKAQSATHAMRALHPTITSADDAADSTVSSAVSTSNSLVTGFISAKQSISSTKATLASAQSDLATNTGTVGTIDLRSAQLNVQQKLQAYNDHFVTAPFDGVVATIAVDKGSTVSANTKIATLVTKNQLAKITLNEVDVAKVKVGQKATLTYDAVSGLSISGTVAEVEGVGTVTQGVVSYGVKISFDTQDDRIKPGMTVNAQIQTAVAQDVLVVPTSAVKTTNGQSYVQVFTPALDATSVPAGQAILSTQVPERIPVEIGITDSKNTEILSGLTIGEQVVVRSVTGTAAVKSSAAAATTRTTSTRSVTGGGPPAGF